MFAMLVWLVGVTSVASAAAFRPRGTAPYSNDTTTTTAPTTKSNTLTQSSSTWSEASSTASQPSYRTRWPGNITSQYEYTRPTGQPSGRPVASVNSTNITTTDPSCTVNIPSANLEWWYAATYESVIGTLTGSAANWSNPGDYLTLVPNTATWDVSSAISTDTAWTESVSYDSEWDMYWTVMDPYTVIPTAATTSIITQNAALPLPSGNMIPSSDYSLYQLSAANLPSPSVSIAGVGNSTTAITSATPFVYFTAYEVEEAINGSATTKTVSLAQPSAFEYQIKGIESSAIATGPVPNEFMQQIPESSCRPGIIQGEVTVLVVVSLFYLHIPHAVPFLVHVESTALGWDDSTVVVQVTSDGVPFTMTLDAEPTETTQAMTAAEGTALPNVLQPTSQTPPIVAEPGSPSQTVGTIGGMPVVVGPSSVAVVGGQTLQPGGSPITIGGNTISLAPSATAIVVGTKTSSLPEVIFPAPTQAPAPPVLIIGSSTLTANAATQFLVGAEQTLTPGGTATVDGTVVSLGPSASFVVVGGSTQILAPPGATPQVEVIIGGSTITALPSNANAHQGADGNSNPGPSFVISGQTLAPGHVITVDGTTISLAPSGSLVVVNGVTFTPTAAAAAAAQTIPPLLTIGNGLYSPLPGTGISYMIGTAILTPGGMITADGTTISLSPGATLVVVNGVTTTLSPQAIVTNPPLLTIGSHTYTAQPGSGTTFIIGDQILTPGGTITLDGTTISLAPYATELIYGSSGRSTTTALFPATTTKSQSITGFSSAPASAGATGTNSEATSTRSKGIAKSMNKTGVESWVLSLIMGVLSVWV